MNRNEGGNRSSFTDGRQAVKRLTQEHFFPRKRKEVKRKKAISPEVGDNKIVLSSATPSDIAQIMEEQDRKFLELASQGMLTPQWRKYGRRRKII